MTHSSWWEWRWSRAMNRMGGRNVCSNVIIICRTHCQGNCTSNGSSSKFVLLYAGARVSWLAKSYAPCSHALCTDTGLHAETETVPGQIVSCVSNRESVALTMGTDHGTFIREPGCCYLQSSGEQHSRRAMNRMGGRSVCSNVIILPHTLPS